MILVTVDVSGHLTPSCNVLGKKMTNLPLKFVVGLVGRVKILLQMARRQGQPVKKKVPKPRENLFDFESAS